MFIPALYMEIGKTQTILACMLTDDKLEVKKIINFCEIKPASKDSPFQNKSQYTDNNLVIYDLINSVLKRIDPAFLDLAITP